MPELKLISSQTPNGQFHIIVDQADTAIASGFGPVSLLNQRLPVHYRQYKLNNVLGHRYSKFIDKYFEGELDSLNAIVKKYYGSDFQKFVWGSLHNIAPGKTLSYKKLAEITHKPKAFRSVGNICKSNKLILLVPCHRVIKSDGGMGGYLYGTEIKKSLLAHEANYAN